MSAKILLYVCASHATVAEWRGQGLLPSRSAGRMDACRKIPNNPEGWAAFNDLLLSRPGTPVYLLVDSVEEEYRSETLPHVRGRAQSEMAARKLRQIFRSVPFSAAWRQGREADKRRDDRYLFTALVNTDLLRPWLDILTAREAPLAGIYQSSMINQALVEYLRPASQHLLLVTEQTGGLRQSFFHQQSLRFSRLTALDATEATHVTTYAAEIGKTRFYLNSQRLLPREERLNIFLVYQDPSLAELSGWLNADPNFQCHVISASELGARLGIEPAILKSSPDALLLNLLAMHPPRVNLAQPELRRVFRQHQARLALYGISITIMLAATFWGGSNLYRKQEYLGQASQAMAQAKRTEDQYFEAVRRQPHTPASVQIIKQAVDVARGISARQTLPQIAMATVSRALEAAPGIVLTRLQWHPALPSQATGVVRSKPSGLEQPTAAEVEGEIGLQRGDYRTASALVEGFMRRLKEDQSVAVAELLQAPLDTGSNASLSGTAGTDQAALGKAKFRVRIVLKDPLAAHRGGDS